MVYVVIVGAYSLEGWPLALFTRRARHQALIVRPVSTPNVDTSQRLVLGSIGKFVGVWC